MIGQQAQILSSQDRHLIDQLSCRKPFAALLGVLSKSSALCLVCAARRHHQSSPATHALHSAQANAQLLILLRFQVLRYKGANCDCIRSTEGIVGTKLSVPASIHIARAVSPHTSHRRHVSFSEPPDLYRPSLQRASVNRRVTPTALLAISIA